jgi:hypothetical protein
VNKTNSPIPANLEIEIAIAMISTGMPANSRDLDPRRKKDGTTMIKSPMIPSIHAPYQIELSFRRVNIVVHKGIRPKYNRN